MATATAPPPRTYLYYDFIMVAFVTVQLCTNLISAPKRVMLGRVDLFGQPHDIVFGAGVLFFPITYFFGDILTEVYGYARSRRVVWAGFGALTFASFLSWTVVQLPPDPAWQLDGIPGQQHWQAVFGSSWRVVVASMLGFWAGEFANSYTMAKMKIWTKGRYLWTRTIGSTIIGEAVDSMIFLPVAFAYIWSWDKILQVMVTNYTLKVAWEVIATPMTYRVVGFLKRAEDEDYYDRGTDFTPFSIQS